MRIMRRSAKKTGGSMGEPDSERCAVGYEPRPPTVDATFVDGQADRGRRRGATPHRLDAVAVILAGIDLNL
jgi:hypothetical protein